MTIRSLAITIFSAGMALAQTTATQPAQGTPGPRGRGPGPNGFGGGPGRGGPRGGFDIMGRNAEARLTKQLGLNATQQNTLHSSLANAQVQTQGMREKETTLRKQLGVAVKSGSESSIESATRELESLHQQQSSIHAKTLATIYGSLDAAQQKKFEPMMNRELGVPGPGRGPGGRGPRPAGPARQPQAPQQQ